MSIFNEYFSFSKGEKRGVFVLITILLLLIVSYWWIDEFEINHTTDFSEFEKVIDEFEKEQILHDDAEKKRLKTQLFPFNPNTISDKEWKKLGFKDWQIKAIHKYKAKGGFWKTKKEVQKIYGLTDSSYRLLEPFIALPEKTNHSSPTAKKDEDHQQPNTQSATKLMVDLNRADTTQLKKLNGIGSVYALRIVKYRDLLGGLNNFHQLQEVYGLKQETIEQISSSLIIDQTAIIKLNINTASAKAIQAHPYFNWNTANAIVNYRKSHGRFKQITDVKKIHLITDKIYPKIAPYLTTH